MQLLLWAAIVLGSVALDQWTKYLAAANLNEQSAVTVIEGILGLTLHRNDGAAWGIGGGFRWPLVIVSSVAILAVSAFVIKKRRELPALLGIAVAMIVGGGIGNQIDRIYSGLVVDFLEFQFIQFPIFNVADCFVTVGAVMIVLDMLFFHRKFYLSSPGKETQGGVATLGSATTDEEAEPPKPLGETETKTEEAATDAPVHAEAEDAGKAEDGRS